MDVLFFHNKMDESFLIAAYIHTASNVFACHSLLSPITVLTNVLNPAETTAHTSFRLLKDFECRFYAMGLLKGKKCYLWPCFHLSDGFCSFITLLCKALSYHGNRQWLWILKMVFGDQCFSKAVVRSRLGNFTAPGGGKGGWRQIMLLHVDVPAKAFFPPLF